MSTPKKKLLGRLRRHRRIRARVAGSAARPRLAVYRSSKQIYAQVIDDVEGRTLCAASSLGMSLADDAKGANVTGAKAVGMDLAAKAKDLGIERVAFDRGGYRYHGRVKALADGAREGGLEF